MESPHSYTFKNHATKVSSSSSINTHGGPIFPFLLFPYRWSKNEVMGMPQNLLAPHKKIMPLSTTSIVASNDSLDHLPFRFVAGTLFVFANLCIVFDIVKGKTFSLSASCQSNTHFISYKGH
jgi:hypothetical protein